jgi:hypothetical protein
MPTKILPKTPPANPGHLLAAYKDLSSALGRMTTAPWRAADTPASSAAIKAAESAMMALIPDLVPEHALMKQALYAGSLRVLEYLLEVHGAQPYTDIHSDQPIALSEPIKRGNIDVLKVLHHAGFDLTSYANTMLRQIWRHRDPVYLSFVRNDLAITQRFCDTIELPGLLNDVPDFLVGELAAEFRDTLGSDALDLTTRKMQRDGMSIPFKYFALLIHTGRPLEKFLGSYYPTRSTDPVAKLIKMTKSAHGRLELHRLEPTMEGIIARPIRDSEFYGIDDAEASYAIKHWPEGPADMQDKASTQ